MCANEVNGGVRLIKRAIVQVIGRVQGVGFRYFTQHLAIEYGIVGWVRNEEDGTVLIDAQGSDESINQFLDKVKGGPSPFARVEDIKIEYLQPTSYRKFLIK